MTWAKSHSTAAPLWFRRWSRSRAAVFRSLGKSVAIGHLSVTILTRLERKTPTLLTPNRVHSNPYPTHTQDNSTDAEDIGVCLLYHETLAQQTIQTACTAEVVINRPRPTVHTSSDLISLYLQGYKVRALFTIDS